MRAALAITAAVLVLGFSPAAMAGGGATVIGAGGEATVIGAGGGATAIRVCAYESTSVWRASTSELRSALVCLIDRARTRRRLPALFQQRHLDAAAQGHSDAMVNHHYFGHRGVLGSGPGARISAAGFDWGAVGETISTGYGSAWQAVWGWLASPAHCEILLSPMYRYIGIGVDPRGVRGVTGRSGTWTADLALPLGWQAPSGDWAPADGCPY